jgi:hypothetical protein
VSAGNAALLACAVLINMTRRRGEGVGGGGFEGIILCRTFSFDSATCIVEPREAKLRWAGGGRAALRFACIEA